MNKKGFMHTLEAVLAITIMFLFITFIVQKPYTDPKTEKTKVLITLTQDEEFRSCLMANDVGCVEKTVRAYLPARYDFAIQLGSTQQRTDLPTKDINTDVVYVAGNTTTYDPKIVVVYYWNK